MKHALMALMLFVVTFSSCSDDKRAFQVASNFFHLIQNGNYKDAYSLLCDNDKAAMTADSFFVYFFNISKENSNSMAGALQIGTIEFRDSLLLKINRDTLVYKISANVLDEALFSKLRDAATGRFKLNRNFNFPKKLDTLEICKVIRSKNNYSIYLGLQYFMKYQEFLNKAKSEYNACVDLFPLKLDLTQYTSEMVLGNLNVRIKNNCKVSIEDVSIFLKVGHADYGNSIRLYSPNPISPNTDTVVTFSLDDCQKLWLLNYSRHAANVISFKSSELSISPDLVNIDSDLWGNLLKQIESDSKVNIQVIDNIDNLASLNACKVELAKILERDSKE
jgi:hypothetical protein